MKFDLFKQRFALLLLLLTGQAWAAFSLAVEVPATGGGSTQIFPPESIVPVPNQTQAQGTTLTLDGQTYIKCQTSHESTVNNPQWALLNNPDPTKYTINVLNGVVTAASPSVSAPSLQIRCTNNSGTYVSNAFAWNVTGLLIATGKFVDCSLAGSGGSGSLANPWHRLSDITGMTTSTDLWIKSGSDCNQIFRVNWNGTASDNVIVGGYYVSGGVAYQNTPTNYTVSTRPHTYVYAQPQPTIRGSYVDSCRATWATAKCYWRISYDPAAGTPPPPGVSTVPSDGVYVGLVETSGHYITIQDLIIRDSASDGVYVRGASSTDKLFVTIKRNRVFQSAQNAITFSGTNSVVVRENWVRYWMVAWRDNQPKVSTWVRGEGIGGGGTARQILVENNVAMDSAGGTMASYGGAYMLWRGNLTGNSWRESGISGGQNREYVIEQHIDVGGCDRDTYGKAGDRCAYWSIAIENFTPGPTEPNSNRPGSKVVRRNSLVGATNAIGLHFRGEDDVATSETSYLEHRDLGNTIISAGNIANGVIGMGIFPETILDFWGVRFAGNLFVVNGDANNCEILYNAATSDNLFRDHNFWTTSQAQSACRSATDVVSANHGIPAFTFNQGFDGSTSANNFRPLAAGDADTVGIVDTEVIMENGGRVIDTENGWDWVLSQRVWLPGPADCPEGSAMPSGTEFRKALTTDFCGNPRLSNFAGAMKPL